MAIDGYGNTPKVGSIDTVDVVRATDEQLGQYAKADEKISQLEVPQLYNSADPHARIFVAMFDGTGNSLANDPDNPTNIGMLKEQLRRVSEENPSIQGQYLEGPGTQKNPLTRTLDGATGYTYEARMEKMYEAFQKQSAKWLKEDPNAKISLMSTGFSRGAEQAAGFSRMVHERGITASIEMDTTIPKEGSISRALGAVHKGLGKDSGLPEPEAKPPLRAPGSIPQSVVLYDPVGTGMPNLHDRHLPPSVVTGMQINAADEKRSAFPVTNNIEQGVSDDGRFLAVTVPGAHSDVGGGYKLKALSDRAFNLATNFYNKVLGHDAIRKVDISTDPDHSVIHDSTQHKIIYKKVEERGVINLPTREAVDPVLREQYPIKGKSDVTPAPQTGPAQDKPETRSAQEGVPVRPDPAAISRGTADRAPEPAQVKSEAPRDAANRAPEPAPAKSEPPREATNRAAEPATAKPEPQRETANRAPEPAPVKSEPPREATNRAAEPAPAKPEPPRDATNRAAEPAPAKPEPQREAANRAPEPAPVKSEPPREATNRAAEPAPAKPEPPRDAVASAVPAPATDGKAEFAKAIKAAGLELKEPPVMDGTLQRVPVAGRAPDNRDGAY
ncbi:phospholipase effector Tle1 domain-containing protein, partial [Massilia pseudoviolaceinigra]|uniref:phospholipase effector Tle1 domain-containing protein n=1 Tax=Massilia pseudoviolaceinigra TaxID=3057165 RepID=UPI0027964749